MIPDITAGESIKYTQSFADYNPTTDTLVFDLVTDGQKQQVTASDNGDNTFLIEVDYSTTEDWKTGPWHYSASILNGDATHDDYGVKKVVEEGTFEVKPRFSIMDSGYDNRSHVKKVLDALEDTLLGKASIDQLSYTIAGRSLSRMSPTELLEWRDRYKTEYRRELDAQKINAGLGTGSKIKVRMPR